MSSFDIILTSFNRLDYLKRTVSSLLQSGAIQDCNQFIIVDNHSIEPGVREFLEESLTQLKKTFIILRPQNDGWARANNDALGISRGEYVFLTNNDVEYTLNFHKKMFEIFEAQPNIGILGVWRHMNHGFIPGGVSTPHFREMDNVPAVGWMLKKSTIEKVGMLWENGPCETKGGNGEDTAYVGRVREAGFLVGVPGEDIATHLDGY